MLDNAVSVLYIEDNPGDIKLIELLLEAEDSAYKTFDLICVNSLREALPLLENGGIDVVLLDFGLPDARGLDCLLRVHTAAPSLPIVVLSMEGDEALAIRSVQLGAQDFLVKHNISGLLLRRSLCYAIERKQLLEKLQYLAHYDALTGLPNRKLFYDRLKQEIINAQRSNKSIALLFLDLNDFKKINDSMGHQVGDALLREVAERLTKSVRASDCVARMGGDEFTVILTSLSYSQDIAVVADKILQALAEPFLLNGNKFIVYASLGIAVYPDDSEDMEVLITAADTAMYQAKGYERDKRSRFQFFSSNMGTKATQLNEAFKRGEFELYYQPEVDIRSGAIIGMEALLRWRHPEQGILTPALFMQELEDSHLIVPVGEWVIKNACAQNKLWQQQGLPAVVVSINISTRQFRHHNFAANIIRTVRQAHLDPSWVELDFHEDTLWRNEPHALKQLQRLNEFGIKLSLDNFGSGLISFKTLTHFPIHSVKIDQTLIQPQIINGGESIIAKAVLEIAHTFNIKGLAIGVETEEQLAMAHHIACDDAQGFLYSKPLAVDAATQLLTSYYSFVHSKRGS